MSIIKEYLGVFFFSLVPLACIALILPPSIAELQFGVVGERDFFHKTKISRINFENVINLKSRYATAWIEAGRERPTFFPDYKFGFRSEVIIREEKKKLRIRSNLPFEFHVGEQHLVRSHRSKRKQWFTEPLAPGSYPFWVVIHKERQSPFTKNRESFFALHEVGADGEVSAVTYKKEMSPFKKYGGYYLLAIFLFSAALVVTGRKASFIEHLKRHSFLLSMIIIFSVSLFLRSYDHHVQPRFLETADEYNNAWIGYHLLTEGTPRGWGFEEMIGEGEKVRWFGDKFNFTDTKFHPMPTFALLIGSVLVSSGVDDMYDISLRRSRLVPVFMGALSACFVFLAARYIFSLGAAFLAALTYATLPIAVLNGRLVKDDNLLSLLGIVAFSLLLWILKKPQRMKSLLLCVVGGLGCVVKQTGIFLPASVIFILLQNKMLRPALGVIGAMLFSYSCYFAYGYLIDWQAFRDQLLFMGNLKLGFSHVATYFTHDIVAHHETGRGVMLWLWLALCMVWPRKKPSAAELALFIFPLFYLIVISVARMDGAVYGWYYMPLLPFLCISAGRFLEEWYTSSSPLHAVLFVLLLLFTLAQMHQLSGVLSTNGARFIVAFGLAPYFLSLLVDSRFINTWSRAHTVCLGLAAVFLNVLYVLDYSTYYA